MSAISDKLRSSAELGYSGNGTRSTKFDNARTEAVDDYIKYIESNVPKKADFSGLDYVQLPVVGNLIGSASSGISGIIGGAAEYAGLNNVADYFQKEAQDREKRMDYWSGEKIAPEVSSDYLLGGSFTRDAGNVLGSGLLLAGLGRLMPAAIPSAIGATTIGQVASKAPFFSRLAQGAYEALPSVGLEAMAEGGNAMQELRQQGVPLEEREQIGQQIASDNAKLLLGTQGLEKTLLNRFGNIGKALYNGEKAGLKTATAIPEIGANWLMQGIEEGEQEGFSNKALGKEYSYNPLDWYNNPELQGQKEAFETGIAGTTPFALFGLGGNYMANRMPDEKSTDPWENAFNTFKGQRMKNGDRGCVEAVTKIGAEAGNTWIGSQLEQSVVDGDTLASNAQRDGLAVIAFDPANVERGDIILYNDTSKEGEDGLNVHSVIADGNGGIWGNSSSQHQVTSQNSYDMGDNLVPATIIKASAFNNGVVADNEFEDEFDGEEDTASDFDTFMAKIGMQESGGNYDAVNADSGAKGKYQIMPDNWQPWAVEAGLDANAEMTPENQEIVARHKLKQYYDKYGEKGALVAWYAGEGNAERYVKGETTDVWGREWTAPQDGAPSIQSYVDEALAQNVPNGGRKRKTRKTQNTNINSTGNEIQSDNATLDDYLKLFDDGNKNSMTYADYERLINSASDDEVLANANKAVMDYTQEGNLDSFTQLTEMIGDDDADGLRELAKEHARAITINEQSPNENEIDNTADVQNEPINTFDFTEAINGLMEIANNGIQEQQVVARQALQSNAPLFVLNTYKQLTSGAPLEQADMDKMNSILNSPAYQDRVKNQLAGMYNSGNFDGVRTVLNQIPDNIPSQAEINQQSMGDNRGAIEQTQRELQERTNRQQVNDNAQQIARQQAESLNNNAPLTTQEQATANSVLNSADGVFTPQIKNELFNALRNGDNAGVRRVINGVPDNVPSQADVHHAKMAELQQSIGNARKNVNRAMAEKNLAGFMETLDEVEKEFMEFLDNLFYETGKGFIDVANSLISDVRRSRSEEEREVLINAIEGLAAIAGKAKEYEARRNELRREGGVGEAEGNRPVRQTEIPSEAGEIAKAYGLQLKERLKQNNVPISEQAIDRSLNSENQNEVEHVVGRLESIAERNNVPVEDIKENKPKTINQQIDEARTEKEEAKNNKGKKKIPPEKGTSSNAKKKNAQKTTLTQQESQEGVESETRKETPSSKNKPALNRKSEGQNSKAEMVKESGETATVSKAEIVGENIRDDFKLSRKINDAVRTSLITIDQLVLSGHSQKDIERYVKNTLNLIDRESNLTDGEKQIIKDMLRSRSKIAINKAVKQIKNSNTKLAVDTSREGIQKQAKINREKQLELVKTEFPTATNIVQNEDSISFNLNDEKVRVDYVDRVIATEERKQAYRRDYGKEYTDDVSILGDTQTIDGEQVITLLNKLGNEDTLSHEAFHLAFRTALTKAQQKILLDKYGNEEAVAEAYRKLMNKSNARGTMFDMTSSIGRLFQKIWNFANSLFNVFNNGCMLHDAESIMYAIADGSIYELNEENEKGIVAFLHPALLAAWHGTPHKFDSFSTDFVGSGEGSQVHGWGIYFALNKDVADSYTKITGGRSITINGKEFGWHTTTSTDLMQHLNESEYLAGNALYWNQGNVEEAISSLEKNLIESTSQETKKIYSEAINSLKIGDISSLSYLYQVDIPSTNTMLREDKPFSEQPKQVQDALEKMWKEYKDSNTYSYKQNDDKYDVYRGDELLDTYDDEELAKQAVDENTNSTHIKNLSNFTNGREILSYVRKNLSYFTHDYEFPSSDKGASLWLNKYGIQGISYNGSRDGECCVVFNDKAVKILERNGEPVNNADEHGVKLRAITNTDKQLEEVRKQYEGTDQWMKAPNGKPTNLTERQWLQVRTPNFKNWFGDWENDPKNASKVVDENGEPLVVYHGTPLGGFEVFNRELNYFTADKEYADRYQDPGASSDYVKGVHEELGKAMTYPVFLNIRKPFDTRKAKERKIFEKEFYRQWGNGAPLSEKGLPDWTDSDDFREFFEENDYDYDGLLLDEGGVPTEDGNVKSRGISYVAFNSNQIKSATDNSGDFSTENDNIKYSRAVSNPNSAENLKKNGDTDTRLDKLPKVDYTKLNKTEKDIMKFGKALGVPVHFVTHYDPNYRGVFTHNGEIFINRKATVPAKDIFIHEFVHWLKASGNEAIYDSLSACLENINGVSHAKRLSEYRKSIFNGERMTNDEIIEEMICDAMSHTVTANRLINDIGKINSSIAEKIVGHMKGLWDKFCNAVGYHQGKPISQQSLPNHLSANELAKMDAILNRQLANIKGKDGKPVFAFKNGKWTVARNGKTVGESYNTNPISATMDRQLRKNTNADKQLEEVRKQYEGTDQWMKAPNGKPTNLTERQWLQVRTPNFKEWFGDWENDPENASKVVDENGEPMVVYHGTDNGGFDVFSIDKAGTRTGQDSAKLGAFFHEYKDYAEAFADYGRKPKSQVYEVFLNIRKPLTDVFLSTADGKKLESIKNKIEKGNHDGIIDLLGEHVVFNPNQIKSATDNSGDFSTENDNIKYSRVISNARQAVDNYLNNRNDVLDERELKRRLESISGLKIKWGKVTSDDKAIIKTLAGIIRAKKRYDFESVVPLMGDAICGKLHLPKGDKAMNAYITEWLLTSNYNESSPQGKAFKRAMRNNPVYGSKLIDVQLAFLQWNSLSADEQQARTIKDGTERGTSKDRIKEYFRNLYDQFVEELEPINRLVKEIEKVNGKKLTKSVNPYIAFRMFRGHYGKAMTMVEGKTDKAVAGLKTIFPNISWDNFKTIQMIFDEVGVKTKEDIKEFAVYCTAKHFKDINAYNRTMAEEIDKANKTVDHANTDKVWAKNNEKTVQQAKDFLDKNKNFEPYEVPSAFTEDKCDKTIAKYSNNAKFIQGQQDIVRYSKALVDIMYSSGVISKDRMLELKNKWANYVPLHRAFEENEEAWGDSLKRMKGSSEAVINPFETLIHNTFTFMKSAEKNKAKRVLAGVASMSDLGAIIEEVDKPSPRQIGNTITYYVDGKPKYLETDPSIVKAVNNMGLTATSSFCRFFKKLSSVARACFTSLNPSFALRNTMRDVQDVFVYNKGITPHDLLLGIKEAVKHGLATHGIGNDSELYYEWMASGAAQASAVALDREYSVATMRKMTKSWDYKSLSDFFDMTLNYVQSFAEYSEYGTRIAVYNATKRNAKKNNPSLSPSAVILESAFASRDQMDFARGGKASRDWNNWAIFANASIQGWDKFYRAYKEDPKGILAKMGMACLCTLALSVLFGYDDDWYKELPDFQKQNFWIMKFGNTIVRIPKGQDVGLRFFTNAFDKMIGSTFRGEKNEKYDFFKPLVDLLPSIFPTALMPTMEALFNYSWFRESPIVPRYQQNLPEYLQFDNKTSPIAKGISNLSRYFGFDTGISPRKIDHIIYGYTGYAVSTPLQAGTMLYEGAFGDGIQVDFSDVTKYPFLSGITAEVMRNPKSVTTFYEKFDKQSKWNAEFKQTKEKPNGYDPKLYKEMETVSKSLSKLNKEERELLGNRSISVEEKNQRRKKINEKRINLVKKFS